MPAHECRQDLQDGPPGVVPLAREPLQRKDSSDANVDAFRVPELIHCTRVAVGDLSLAIKFVTLAVQRERARRVDRTDCRQRACKHREQRRPDTTDILSPLACVEPFG